MWAQSRVSPFEQECWHFVNWRSFLTEFGSVQHCITDLPLKKSKLHNNWYHVHVHGHLSPASFCSTCSDGLSTKNSGWLSSKRFHFFQKTVNFRCQLMRLIVWCTTVLITWPSWAALAQSVSWCVTQCNFMTSPPDSKSSRFAIVSGISWINCPL